MKNNKASGWDTIVTENIRYRGDVTISALTWIMNAIIHREKLPRHYKRGLIVPIPKVNKDRVIKDNNRGITLLTTFYKILERELLNREKDWFSRKTVIDELQGGGRKHCSSLHTTMLLQEVVACNLSKGENVHVAFLDIKKAFDTV